jgi:hypothetical protein
MGKLRLSFKFGGNLLSELWRELPDGIELSGKGKKEAAMLMIYSAMTKRGPIQPRVYQNHCKNLLAMLLTMIRSTGYRALQKTFARPTRYFCSSRMSSRWPLQLVLNLH